MSFVPGLAAAAAIAYAIRHTAPHPGPFGLLAGVQRIDNLAASAIAGILWTTLSPSWVFAYLAAWMAVALVGLARSPSARPIEPTTADPPGTP